MKLYNVAEAVVRKATEEAMRSVDCCHCQQCMLDVIAVSLNHVKPRYVVTDLGEALTTNSFLSTQKQAEVMSVVLQSIQYVKEKPRHPILPKI